MARNKSKLSNQGALFGGAPRPAPAMARKAYVGLSIQTKNPYEDYSFRPYHDFEELGGALAKNISKNPAYYEFQIEKGLSGSAKEMVALSKEVTQAEFSIEKVERLINTEDLAYNSLIITNDRELADAEAAAAAAAAKVEEVQSRGKLLRQNQLMTTGKAKAFVYVVKKALRNIQRAMMSDVKDGLLEMESNKREWSIGIKDDQDCMLNGEANAIELILAKMRDEHVQE
eukprot:CAMPEP_0181093092 /NCGR_PEP_ID=MMETSP1071-20121207/9265_1 /TAXON_ID=35127 /ORGANISM="Thalassiosira sp., Strain NH16" /LENGTH=228 /DNA_ID=CAMNT_0023175311 /DNA_START=161 /DNA_END=847 /DNA_ORIENTATION=-